MFDYTVASAEECAAALRTYGYRLDARSDFVQMASPQLVMRASGCAGTHVAWDPMGSEAGWLLVGGALEIARETCQMIADTTPDQGPLSAGFEWNPPDQTRNRVRRLIREEIAAEFPLSGLVGVLGDPYGTIHQSARVSPALNALVNLGSRARNLSAPALDYEAAARLAGWQQGSDRCLYVRAKTMAERGHSTDVDNFPCVYADSWQQACDRDKLEPVEVPVSGHWAVSSWLATQLVSRRQRVDTRFAGLNVWARTSPEADLADDPVLRAIAIDRVYPAVDEEAERTRFEAWALREWKNGNPPENAWKGWIAGARAAACIGTDPG